MYDWPEVQPRNDAFWSAVRVQLAASGVDAPAALVRPEDLAAPWTDSALVLGQTCGLPYVSGKCGEAVIVARPSYRIEGTGEGTYASALICRADDERDLAAFMGTRAAINEIGSQSGCNALKDAFLQAGLTGGPLFAEVVMSGAHRMSANLVAAGDADIAALDAVAWALHAECEPEAHARLRVLGWTRHMPALPFIAAPAMRPHLSELRQALATASSDACPTGVPRGIHPATDSDYDPIRNMARKTADIRLS